MILYSRTSELKQGYYKSEISITLKLPAYLKIYKYLLTLCVVVIV